MTGCRLGYEEHDGYAYCFEHYGFAFVAARQRKCDQAPSTSASPTHEEDQ